MAIITPYSSTTCTITQGHIFYNNVVQFEQDEVLFAPFIRQAYKQLKWHYPKFYKMSPLCQLGTIAAQYLFQNISLSNFAPDAIAVIVANKHATSTTDQRYLASFAHTDHYYPDPNAFVYTLPNTLIGEWCIQYNIRGQTAFFIQSEPDWDFLLGYSQLLLQDHDTQCCLIGWVDYHEESYQATLQFISPTI